MPATEITIATVLTALIVGAAIALVLYWCTRAPANKSGTCGSCASKKPAPKVEKFTRGNDFYIYNYYAVPVDVKVVPLGTDREQDVVSQVPREGRLGVRWSMVSKTLLNGAKVRAYARKPGAIHRTLIGESTLRIPEDTTIKALHVGQSSAHEDLSLASEITKSSLGSALARLRIVNTTPRKITLRIGTETVEIQPHSSYMYLGENYQGIHLGAVIRDMDGYLKDFVIDKPMTDVHLGFISDTQTPLYTGSKIGGELDDTVEGVNYPQELHGLGGIHNGALRDRAYIP